MIRKPFDTNKTAWTADLEYWISGRELDGTANPRWRTEEGFLELHKDLGIIPYYWYKDFWVAEAEYDSTVEVVTEHDDDLQQRWWKTPKGTIYEVVKFMTESCSWAHVKYPVATKEDLDVLLYLTEHSHLKMCEHVKRYHQRAAKWAEYGGIPSLALPRCALSAFFYQWAGILNGVYLMADCQEKIDYLFGLYDSQQDMILQDLAEIRPKIIHFADNVSADNMAGYFDQYMKPIYRKRLSVLHEADICCVVHLDGVVHKILDKLSAVGMDAIEALTPVPGGDLTVKQIRQESGREDLVLWGGVPGILFSPTYSEEELSNHVENLLKAWEGLTYVVGVADQVPADGDIEKVRVVSQLIKTYDRERGA